MFRGEPVVDRDDRQPGFLRQTTTIMIVAFDTASDEATTVHIDQCWARSRVIAVDVQPDADLTAFAIDFEGFDPRQGQRLDLSRRKALFLHPAIIGRHGVAGWERSGGNQKIHDLFGIVVHLRHRCFLALTGFWRVMRLPYIAAVQEQEVEELTMAGGQLEGRRIVVTGAASGMGEGVAELFSREGARLVLLDIAEEKLSSVAERTGQAARTCDVSQESSVDDAIDFAANELGGIDGIVNVAGILVPKTVSQTSWDEAQRLLAVNLGGPFLTCRAALPHLERAERATIVNVSSLSGVRSQPRMAVYSATKAGLVAFTEALSGELPPNIRANSVCPGVIRTPMIDFMFSQPGSEEKAAETIRAGRLASFPR